MEKEDDGDIKATDFQLEPPEELQFFYVKPYVKLLNSVLPSSSESENIATTGTTAEVQPTEKTHGDVRQRRRTPSVSEEPRMTRGRSKSLENASSIPCTNTQDTEKITEAPEKVEVETTVEQVDKEATSNKNSSPESDKLLKKSTQTGRKLKISSVKSKSVEKLVEVSPVIKKEYPVDENEPEMPQLEPAAALVATETAADDVNNNNSVTDDTITPLTPAQPKSEAQKSRKKKENQLSEKPQQTTKMARAKRSVSRESTGDSKKNTRSANKK